MTDERYKAIMVGLGQPHSQSLIVALRQVANEVAQEVQAAERERCIHALLAVRDKSGQNSDGSTWLMRATKQDYIDALVGLGPNVRANLDPTAGEEA